MASQTRGTACLAPGHRQICVMAQRHTVAVLWFRQDLRLSDNAALTAALQQAETVLPVFVLPDIQSEWPLGGASAWWLHHSLQSLSATLAEKGASLILRRGEPAQIIASLAQETGAATIHAGVCAEPAWRRHDDTLTDLLHGTGIMFTRHRTTRLFDPDTIRTKTGGIYGMFTPFANAVRAMPAPPPPARTPAAIPGPHRPPKSDTLASWQLLPTKPDWSGGLQAAWQPGERAAQARARHVIQHTVSGYATGRNLPGQDLTSRLSPHLHWGELSAVWLWHAISRATIGEGERVFLNELIWRDFAAYVLWHKPSLPDANLRADFNALPWRTDPAGLSAWQRGQTGVPIVDAGMRQLWQTGWMHNRVRMIVASFLVKHLLIDWRDGAAWFWDTLVDADLAANSTNWQWVAGTGIDSQPFFRVFNPVSQGQKFDSDGAYVRAYVPEIAALPNAYLHAPWTAPAEILRAAAIQPGTTYPKPLVDLAFGRQRALDTYKTTVRAAADAS
jgi:deoxyribodipyrimidine photo-lyase